MLHEIYHTTFWDVLEEVLKVVRAQGFNFVDEMPMNLQAPSYGDTGRYMVDVSNGKQERRCHFQVYRLESGTYELNAYIS